MKNLLFVLVLLSACSATDFSVANADEQKALLVIVIDKSASMRDDRKMEFARQAALDASTKLRDVDRISIVAFDSTPFLVMPPTDVSKVGELLEKRLSLLVPVGSTYLLPALALARSITARELTSQKHVIILSDGKFEAPYEPMLAEVEKLKELGCTVSAVTFGKDEASRGLMRKISQIGGGALYVSESPKLWPKVFVDDVKTFLAP